MTTLKARPEQLDLALYAGDGVTVVLNFVNDDDGTPFPTTGTWLAEIRASNYGDLITSFQVTNDEANGTVRLSLTGEQVYLLWPSAVYDVQQIDTGAEPRTWYRGKITIEGDVSRG